MAANWKEERPESWFNSGKSKSGNPTYDGNLKSLTESTVGERLNDSGRFPANLLHDNSEEVRGCFPETKTGSIKPYISKDEGMFGMMKGKEHYNSHEGNSGNASRFFKSIIYTAKASKKDRGSGNIHPTVKPIALMSYLINMVTPKGGTVLDPFAGSGSTLVAAKEQHRNYIGIELNSEYITIAEARIAGVPKTLL